MPNKRLELATSDEGVLLLEFIPEDARPLFELIDRNRDHLSQRDDETAAKYLDFESVLQSITHPKNPDKIRLGIWSDGVLTGTINITPKGGCVSEIGYWVGSEFCGKGLATIATRAVIQYGKSLVDTCEMIAYTHPDNTASQKVLLRAGMYETRRDVAQVWFSFSVKTEL